MAINATNFDGTNDYMLRGGGLTGAADNKQLTISTWVNLNGGDGTELCFLWNADNRVRVYRASGNKMAMLLYGTTGTLLASMVSTNTFTAGSTWLHIIASIDMNAANSGYMYVSDSAEVSAYNPLSNAVIDQTSTDWGVGARTDGTWKMNGCLSEFWYDTSYFDLSTTSNRRKFIDASGNAVDLGVNGENPTGTSPLIYLPNAYTSFETNAGTGGNFTVTGALTDCASTPPEAGAFSPFWARSATITQSMQGMS